MTDLSLCMVSLNCWKVLQDCLESVHTGDGKIDYEIIVVDNGSRDETVQQLKQHYPAVKLIENGRNVGFTKATNQAIEHSSGRYIMWLNTDTVLRPDTLSALCAFLDRHPQVGIVGPKVLNPDGTFQPQCKRGMPTPLVSLSYFLKLDRLFPQSRLTGEYLLTYLSPDESHPVAAVSGCCLLARRQVWEDIGPLDEQIFAFGEDIDWCVRAKQAGWEVWYYPGSQLVHLKGQGGVHSKPYHKAWGMYHGMWVFYRKHLKRHYSLPVTALVWLGVWSGLLAACLAIFIRRRLR